jgi:ABC-type transport system involved in multi-copper enzyme maturation permease subunit
MKRHAASALFWDAVHQVLDNWVFRILAVLTGVFVLFTFVVGFREEEIVLLFGVERWSYSGLLSAFGMTGGVDDPQGLVIDVFLSVVFDQIAGNMGVIFCIAATAFFVPQMIEKGAADVLFHKPLGRSTFYVARYFSGLLFVGMLSVLLASGIYIGLALVSGHHDPGILLAAPLLTYLFGLIYAVSMFVGVLTRSTVASILLTTIFFAFNGCVHGMWTGMAQQELVKIESVDEEDDEEEPEEVRDEPLVVTLAIRANAVLHYALPKTSDADVLARKLRRAVNAPVFQDGTSLVCVFNTPDETEAVQPEPPAALDAPGIAALLGEPRFQLRSTRPEERVTYTILRRPVGEIERERRGETVTVKESASLAATSLRETLASELGVDAERRLLSFGSNASGQPAGGAALSWTREVDAVPRGRSAVLFKGARGDFLYTILVQDDSGEATEERAQALRDEIDRSMGILPRGSAYERNFTLTAPWRFNILFSVGSSLAFVAAMLVLGWWRLTRIEF